MHSVGWAFSSTGLAILHLVASFFFSRLKLPPQQVHPGKALRVYLLSDSYLGLDQEYEVAVA